MEAELRKLTCADLEAELVRIKQAKIITDDYLKEMKSLSKAEIQALTDL